MEKHSSSKMLGGSGGMSPQEILDVLRSILVRFGTLVHHGKVHVHTNYSIHVKRIVTIKYSLDLMDHKHHSKLLGTRDETRDNLSSLVRCG